MKIVHYEEQVDYRELFFRLPLFMGSLLVIIVLFAMGRTALLVSFWACVMLYLLSLLRKATRPSWRKLIEGLIKGATLGSSIAVTCATLALLSLSSLEPVWESNCPPSWPGFVVTTCCFYWS